MVDESSYDMDGVTAYFSESPLPVHGEIDPRGTSIIAIRFPENIFGVAFLLEGARELANAPLPSTEKAVAAVNAREN